VGESPALRQGIDRLFVRFFNGWEMFFPNEPRLGQWSPTVESAVAGERLVFTVALPNVDPKDVGILVVGNQLVIAGERKTDGERSEKSPFSVGRSDERFARILPLPDGVNPEHIRASYRDGVLEISLPLPRGITARRIPIEIK
jgi:HSP20 family protein